MLKYAFAVTINRGLAPPASILSKPLSGDYQGARPLQGAFRTDSLRLWRLAHLGLYRLVRRCIRRWRRSSSPLDQFLRTR